MKQQFEDIKRSSESTTSNFKERFETIASTPATRNVKLWAQSCCGCGCSDVQIMRTVPYDSHLQDGDRVGSFEDSDEVL
jgi:hypothetical protein